MKTMKFLFRTFDFLPNEVVYTIYKYVGNKLKKNKKKIYKELQFKMSRHEKYFLKYHQEKNSLFPYNSI